KKLGQNEVIGFILAGFLLGPFLLNFLHPTDPLVGGFAELGLFVLLFYLGIELSLKEFLGTGSSIFGLAFIDMALTTGLGVLVMLLLGKSLLFAIVVGIMMFSTSTAIVAKFIIDKGLLQNFAAKLSLSILILQDFLGILLLVLVTSLSAEAASVTDLVIAALVFAVTAFYAVYHLSRIVEKWMKANNFGHTEITLYALGVGLVVATLGSVLGLSTAIGAYFAGFALSETDSGRRIKNDVGFLRDFFLVFFFVGFGTTLFYDAAANAVVFPSLGELLFIVGLASLLGFIAMAAHSLSTRVFGGLFGLNDEDSSLSAILLSPLGEFVVIIATVTAGVFVAGEAQLLRPLAFLLILITVIVFQPAYNARKLHQKLFGLLPRLPAPKKAVVKPEAGYLVLQAKDFALNLFVVLCFAWITVLLYNVCFLCLGAFLQGIKGFKEGFQRRGEMIIDGGGCWMVLGKILRAVDRVWKPVEVFAHCDVPCGIYETDTMTHASETVYVMTKKMIELKEGSSAAERQAYFNSMARMVHTKEEWAGKCKSELLILWTDYFKEEHLKKAAGLHEKIWKAAKLCSAVKREASLEKADALRQAVKEISELFVKSKM
ncbi:superoxide dismutase, Ni, partial [archaeon]|nr:superoxide dismutase, Ni [archaeon]